MKKHLIIITFVLFAYQGWSQNNYFSISGGTSFANIEDSDSKANGFRINGLFELNPYEGKVLHGVSIGYIGLNSDDNHADYKLSSWPIYYAPKVLLGQGKFKGFVKGALGMHISSYTRGGSLGDLNTTDFGFYGGASGGVMLTLSEKMFLNAEYELAYLSNSWYRDGMMNSVNMGIGVKF